MRCATEFRWRLAAILLILPLQWCLAQPVTEWQDDDDPPEFLPGLLAQYSVGDRRLEQIDEALLWTGSFDESSGSWRPDAGLPATPFQASWRGFLNVREAGPYRIRFHGSGRFRLSLAGQPVFSVAATTRGWHGDATIELGYGAHELQAEYDCQEHPPALGLYWSGPGFALEPITGSHLTHRSAQTVANPWQLGRELSRALRCSACHNFPRQDPVLAAPALTHLRDNLHPSWLMNQLRPASPVAATESEPPLRRMPHYDLSSADAAAVTAALLDASANSPEPPDWTSRLVQLNRSRKAKEPAVRTLADPALGPQVFVTKGCIACHRAGEWSSADPTDPRRLSKRLFSGGNLTLLAQKRPAAGIARWLEDPSLVNTAHRMPVFQLSDQERLDLHAWLNSLNDSVEPEDLQLPEADLQRGRQLVRHLRCGACHQLPKSLADTPGAVAYDVDGDWTGGCLDSSATVEGRPYYRLTIEQMEALRNYLTHAGGPGADDPQQILLENNCLKCHQRGSTPGIAGRFGSLAEQLGQLADRLPAMMPPSLSSVGDKLHRSAVLESVGRESVRLRPWLDIQMPQFRLTDDQLQRLADHFISRDRIPSAEHPIDNSAEPFTQPDQASWLAAGRLVTPDGFSCQSCHPIADSRPVGIALNAQGSDLTILGNRMREEWFYRWVRNPARIVPRMEMPAIESPVLGLLNDSLDEQLRALWLTLNRPDFKPPKPNPVRVLRNHNQPQLAEYTHVLTDVLEAPRLIVRPLALGLPNRHNLLLDLDRGQLAAWWLGDVARQHTRGKSWYWEPGAVPLVEAEWLERWAIEDAAGELLQSAPPPGHQWAWELDRLQHTHRGIRWHGRWHFRDATGQRVQTLKVINHWEPVDARTCHVEFEVQGLTADQSLRIETSGTLKSAGPRSWQIEFTGGHRADYETARAQPLVDQAAVRLQVSPDGEGLTWSGHYRSAVAADQLPSVELPASRQAARILECVPGFEALQLPLPRSEMPIAMAWDAQGKMFIGSLKGRVLEVVDSDGDGLPDDYRLLSDELPTPYGLQVSEQDIDALVKYGLLRLTPAHYGGPIWDTAVVADGWGYTEDYHDWAVGLERDREGHYFMTLPCQQDDRSPAAARWRGHALKLTPASSPTDGRLYDVESFAAGLRFPMGLALNTSGDLFASDNQGNYKPFNELNHLRYGKRYGFINKLERQPGFAPPTEAPAINIPHPWTRSVNGICFLDTPESLKQAGRQSLFGPWEGHLVGCEMNGRSLIRMSLQQVGDTYQGAAYMLSRSVAGDEPTFEGPIVCQVAPSGALYVGNLLDSGWGGGNNTGSIVRLTPTGQWPLGIAEVRATPRGLEVDFTQAVDPRLAASPDSYSIRSYVRVPTPAYGGEDQQERMERVQQVKLSADHRRVHLKLTELRAGTVYELNVAAIGLDGARLFPSEAHYTMRVVPQ